MKIQREEVKRAKEEEILNSIKSDTAQEIVESGRASINGLKAVFREIRSRFEIKESQISISNEERGS